MLHRNSEKQTINREIDRFFTDWFVAFLFLVGGVVGFFAVSPLFGYFYWGLQTTVIILWLALFSFAKRCQQKNWFKVLGKVFFHIVTGSALVVSFAFMAWYCRQYKLQHNAMIGKFPAILFLLEWLGTYCFNKVMRYLYLIVVYG